MTKTFVYHWKSASFTGGTLYPLNRLKIRFPVLYDNAVKKYQGREWLMNITIPPLRVLWNDVIHISLIHPSLIYKTLSDIGFEHHRAWGALNWFEIPLDDVSGNSILYRNDRDKGDSRIFLDSDFEPVSVDRVRALSSMPEINVKYYRACFEEKNPPLLWGYAPHLLFNGQLDVTNYRIFDWREGV